MYVACIACGGIIEVTLLSLGLSFVYRWLKNRHNKKNCDCCNEEDKEELFSDSPWCSKCHSFHRKEESCKI